MPIFGRRFPVQTRVQKARHIAFLTTVVVSPGSATILNGTNISLTATPNDQYGLAMVAPTATWGSSNAAIASVNSSGVVTGNSVGGPVTITATITSGVTKSGTAGITITASTSVKQKRIYSNRVAIDRAIYLRQYGRGYPMMSPVIQVTSLPVPPYATHLTLSPSAATIHPNIPITIVPTVTDQYNLPLTVGLTWASSNAALVSVNSSGVASWLQFAPSTTVTITATVTSNPLLSATSLLTPAPFPYPHRATHAVFAALRTAERIPHQGFGFPVKSLEIRPNPKPRIPVTIRRSFRPVIHSFAAVQAAIRAHTQGRGLPRTVAFTPHQKPAITTVRTRSRVITSSFASIGRALYSHLIGRGFPATARQVVPRQGQQPTQPIVGSVTVTPSNALLAIGGTQQMTALVLSTIGTPIVGQAVVWSSANASVAPINSSGLVSWVTGGGPVTITGTVGAKSGTAQITTQQQTFDFTTSNPASALVSPTGKVTRVAAGTGYIQITLHSNPTVFVQVPFSW